MTLATFLAAVLYLVAGWFWWRRIVVPGPAQEPPEEWRRGLIEADQRGDIALLVAAKANFVLIWPLVLALGLLVLAQGLLVRGR